MATATMAPDCMALLAEYVSGRKRQLVRWLAGKLRNRHDAEEVLSRGLLKAVQKLHHLREPCKLSSWLGTILLNELRSYVRERNKPIFPLSAAMGIPWNGPSPLDCAAFAECSQELRALIADLPDVDHILLDAHYRLGFTSAEIARRYWYGYMTDEAVRTRLFRARRRLRKRLEVRNAAL